MSEQEAALETLIITREEGLAIVTINNPPMNTLSQTLREELRRTMEQLGEDEQVRAVLINARGRAFCAGAELGGSRSSPPTSLDIRKGIVRLNNMYFSILNTEKPVVCAVNGVAAGGGFTLTLAADIVIASEAATFTTVFIRRGLFPDVGVNYLLPRTVGLHKAKELIFTADAITAKRAYEIGLINRVYPHNNLLEESRKTARKIARKGPVAVSLAKKVIEDGYDKELSRGCKLEVEAFAECFTTSDRKEGIKAFIEKRTPVFTNK